MFWLFVALGSLLEVIGDYYLKSGALVWGVIFYIVGTVFWASALKYEGLAVAVTIFTIINLLMGVGCGLWFFDETLTAHQCAGIFFSCLGVLLLCV